MTVILAFPENAYSPMLATFLGIVMLVRLLQSLNALAPMLVIPLGIVTAANLSQELNAEFPMLVTLFGIEIPVRLSQFWNIPSVMLWMPLPIVTLVSLVQPLNTSVPIAATPLEIVTLVRLVQEANTEFPMLVTLLGHVTLITLQSRNALSPIPVTVLPNIVDGMTTAELVPVYLVIVTVVREFGTVVKSAACTAAGSNNSNISLAAQTVLKCPAIVFWFVVFIIAIFVFMLYPGCISFPLARLW
jgi:hypothetical protein